MSSTKKATTPKGKAKNLPAKQSPTGGQGTTVKGDLGSKQKSWNPANFRIKTGGLP